VMVEPSPSYRLPRSVLPRRYELELEPDLEAGTFRGSVGVELDVVEAVDAVVCNLVDLDVVSATVRGADGEVAVTATTVDDDAEQVRFALAAPLRAGGRYRLEVSYTGRVGDGLQGFYRSRFRDDSGTEKLIGITQFEATDARRAFPCFDEPEMKAVFSLTLVVPDGLTALSSGTCVSSEPAGPGRVRLRFADTIPMSTYILAWVIGPYELTDPVEVDGVVLRIAAPTGRKALTGYGLEVGEHALRYLAGYFGLPYPGDKLDHVAVPDFAFGAMENFGCITYRETALLADPAAASQPELMRIAEVVAHETAHMWFGNLVTMKWWNGIWLNEAFATFMELKATDALRPDWQVWAAQSAGKEEALGVDGLASTRPIEYEVVRPADAEAMFDSLTYEKGGSVLRMLEHYLGEEVFRRGIARYLAEHRFSNTETTDLWDALEAASGQPVRAVMDSWIFQAGYPLVQVEAGPGPTEVTLSQRHFRYRGEGEGHWVVPVRLRARAGGASVERRLLLDAPVSVDLGGPPEWVMANEGGTGFYRAHYGAGIRPSLAALRADGDALERVQLVSDTWALLSAGGAGLDELLDLLASLEGETDPDVWRTAATPLTFLERLAGAGELPLLRRLVQAVAGPGLAQLGWEAAPAEPARLGVTRARLIGLLGTTGADEAVRAEAAARHARWRESGSGLSAEVAGAAVTALAAGGGEATYELLWSCYLDASTPQERIRYLMALAVFPEPELAARTLDLAVSEQVRSQDGPLLIARCLAGPSGLDVAWPWVEDHLDVIVGRFPRNLLVRLLEGIPALADPEVAARVHALLAEHPLPVGGPRVAQIEEQLDVAVDLAGRLRPQLADALAGVLGRR